jgi:cell division protein FtsB
MEEGIVGIAIVGTLTFGGIIITTIALITRAISSRGAGRKELQELRQDISQIKSSIEDMREQLADIIIRSS